MRIAIENPEPRRRPGAIFSRVRKDAAGAWSTACGVRDLISRCLVCLRVVNDKRRRDIFLLYRAITHERAWIDHQRISCGSHVECMIMAVADHIMLSCLGDGKGNLGIVIDGKAPATEWH